MGLDVVPISRLPDATTQSLWEISDNPALINIIWLRKDRAAPASAAGVCVLAQCLDQDYNLVERSHYPYRDGEGGALTSALGSC